MANMQVTIGLGRKPGVDPPFIFSFGKVGFNECFNEIEGFFGVFSIIIVGHNGLIMLSFD
jgi:hypothetical protein